MKLALSDGRAPFIKRTDSSHHDGRYDFLPFGSFDPAGGVLWSKTSYNRFGSCMSCFLAMVAFRLIHRRNISLSERSLLVTGLTIAMLLPADIPYWMAALAGAFAMFAAKEPFGSTGRNPFNPAAAGVAFLTVLWPEEVSRFPAVGPLPLWERGAEAASSKRRRFPCCKGSNRF